MDLASLPELGVGLVYWPALDGVIEAGAGLVDVLECEPQAFWFRDGAGPAQRYRLDPRAFDRVRSFDVPTLTHGVACPLAGTVGVDERQVEPFVESVATLGSPWASEHLSVNRVRVGEGDPEQTGMLLAPLQTPEAVRTAVRNVTELQRALPVPLLFETGVSYLRHLPGEMDDGAFFASVARDAGCGILLDLHNLWANERNGRQGVRAALDQMPLDRVVEVHLAGGGEYRGLWLDAHSGLVPAEVMALAREVLPRLTNLRALIFEIMPQHVGAVGGAALLDQLARMHELWEDRARPAPPHLAPPVPAPADRSSGVPSPADRSPEVPSPADRSSGVPSPALPHPSAWERAVHGAVNPRAADPSADDAGVPPGLAQDVGVAVLRDLVSSARSGQLAGTLELSVRLLLLTLGDDAVREVLTRFWAATPLEPTAGAEAVSFAAYSRTSRLGARVPFLDEVMELELAVHRAVMTDEEQRVVMTADPGPLLGALRDGRVPQVRPGSPRTVVVPPRRRDPLRRAGA